ncbi:unnamed protein product [Schistosoma mattheei]|uniref:Amine oxidase domain-containing protein n=1 Tax=Schistosoma mattheei TaxID=31246 RepID=A0AA85B7Q8_9TREM|nr:unnamed protein product [Schistosoma mattheei]
MLGAESLVPGVLDSNSILVEATYKMSEATFCDVLILGAGISGLAAAKLLTNEGLKTIVLEARSRSGGRIHTVDLPSVTDKSQDKSVVDLGASYLHGCNNSQDVQPLFTLASRLKIATSPAAGDVLGTHRGWECPEVAVWRDNKSGKEIGLEEVADMSFLLDRCLLYILMAANQKKQENRSNKTLATALPSALESCLHLLYKAGYRTSPTLSRREKGIFDSLFARYIAYVNPAHRLSPKLSLGPHFEADAMAGLALNVDQPSSVSKRIYLDWLQEKRTHLSLNGSCKSIARRTDHKWEDRLVLDGFSKFVEFLASGVDIHHRCVARHVYWSNHTDFGKSNEEINIQLIHDSAASWSTKTLMDFIESSNLVCVDVAQYSGESSTLVFNRQSSRRYFARFCIITVPVGVLKGLDRRSAIHFHPCLPSRKRLAIDRLGIPKLGAETHNKVILMFNPSEIFWDRDTPHITCPGAYLHILNCDFYGNPGVLVAHVWGGSKLRITGRSDQAVVKTLLDLLGGMYPSQCPLPEPIYTHVTRWSEDPFSLGAYTAGEVGCSDADRQAYASSLPSTVCPKLLFAGEGTVDSSGGQQCTHGAFSSGVDRALDVLDHIQGSRCRLRDVRIIDYLTGHRYDLFLLMRCANSSGKQESSLAKCIQSSQELVSTESSDSQCSEGDSSPSILDFESIESCILFPKPTRRSTRLTTWISSQASSSLRRESILMYHKKRHSGSFNALNNCSKRCSQVMSTDSRAISKIIDGKHPFSCFTGNHNSNLLSKSVSDSLPSSVSPTLLTKTCLSSIHTSSPLSDTAGCILIDCNENLKNFSLPINSVSQSTESDLEPDIKGLLFSDGLLNNNNNCNINSTLHSNMSLNNRSNEKIIDHIKPTNYEPVFGALPFTGACNNSGRQTKSFSFKEALIIKHVPISM